MWKYNNSNELYHWGVLGMKWGHRKTKTSNTISELRKYRKLERKEKIANKLAANEKKRYNNTQKQIQKYGIKKARIINKAGSLGGAIQKGIGIYTGLGGLGLAAKYAKEGKYKKAGISGAIGALGIIGAKQASNTMKNYRKNRMQINTYEYNQYKKKYGKLVK